MIELLILAVRCTPVIDSDHPATFNAKIVAKCPSLDLLKNLFIHLFEK